MAETKSSGSQILEHFGNRLPRLEASLPSVLQVDHCPQPPADVAELDSLRSTYEGQPAVFPATWIPSWTGALETSSVLEGLQKLLSGVVQVDAFQLHYKASKNHECKDCLQEGTFNLSALENCGQFCIFGLDGERDDGHNLNSNMSLNACDNKHLRNNKKQNRKSIIGTELNKRLIIADDMCGGTNLVSSLYYPIPSSSSEVIDFGVFISQLNFALLNRRDQLWYLTWRGIPALENLESSLVPKEFDFFIRNLFYPTTSPQFIAEDTIVQRNLWVGAIVTSRIHFDALHNLHVCISGKKLFHLYTPSALPCLYPKPWREGALNNFSSMESIFLANQKQHANFFQNVKCWRAEIKAGEAIFIPAGWWHEVFTFEETISANVWFEPNEVTRFRATLMHLKSENYYKFMLQCMERGHRM